MLSYGYLKAIQSQNRKTKSQLMYKQTFNPQCANNFDSINRKIFFYNSKSFDQMFIG